MKQLGRFLRLERVRKDGEHELPLPPRRFASLEEAPVAGPVAPHATAGLERFAPEPAPSLELERPDGDEPFVRCLRCGADSLRHATVCRQCEARLDSEEVRAFNVRLWADMTAAREREAAELRQREASRSGGAATVHPQAHLLAAEFATRERARRALEKPSAWDSFGRGWQSAHESTPVSHLLVGLAVGIPLVLAVSHRATPGVWVAFLGGLVVLFLFAFRRMR